MGWAPRRSRAPIACPCHQKRSAPFRLLPRLFSDALPVPSLSALALALAACGVMRRSVSFGEEFRRIQRGSSLPFDSAAVRRRARLAIKLETIYFANNLHLDAATQLVRCQHVAESQGELAITLILLDILLSTN